MEEPEAEAEVGAAAAEGPLHRVLLPAALADAADAAGDASEERDAAIAFEGSEEGPEAVDAGKTVSLRRNALFGSGRNFLDHFSPDITIVNQFM